MPTIREVWNHGTYIDDWACLHDGDCAKEWLVEYQGIEYVVITDFDDIVLNDPESTAPLFQSNDEEE